MRNMFHRTLVFLAWLLLPATAAAQAQESPSRYDEPDPALDAAVEACLETEGVTVLSEHDLICYNSAIYPEQFLKLANLPETRRIINDNNAPDPEEVLHWIELAKEAV